MYRKKLTLISTTSAFVLIAAAAITVENAVSSKIEIRVKEKLPSASGISASIPFRDIPNNIKSDSIKSINIEIDEYTLKGSDRKTSLAISVRDVSKSQPNQIGFLEITSTIPASTILSQMEFQDAEIIEGALQISFGAGGIGKALLVPEYSNNEIYFQLKSVSVLGSPVPAASLPADIQEEIKSRSSRSITVPKGLKIIAVSLDSEGLSVKFQGRNLLLDNLTL
jgi:hypothetical protein